MNESCNIVVVTGRNAVGKTTATTYLRYWCLSHGIPCERHAITDAQSLFKAMQLDDEVGGLHHTHEWCLSGNTDYYIGHTHQEYKPILPFTVIGNKIPDAMLDDFFTKLSQVPRSDTIYFVEWAAGSNTNPTNTSASEVDYSYTKVKRMFHEGSLPTSWLEQVHSVIHLEASDELRIDFNERNYIPCLEEILNGTGSWPISQMVLRFYGIDDFSEIKDIFKVRNIPVYDLQNDGSEFFEKELESLAQNLFYSYLEKNNANKLPDAVSIVI
jgi:hypothetical protein